MCSPSSKPTLPRVCCQTLSSTLSPSAVLYLKLNCFTLTGLLCPVLHCFTSGCTALCCCTPSRAVLPQAILLYLKLCCCAYSCATLPQAVLRYPSCTAVPYRCTAVPRAILLYPQLCCATLGSAALPPPIYCPTCSYSAVPSATLIYHKLYSSSLGCAALPSATLSSWSYTASLSATLPYLDL